MPRPQAGPRPSRTPSAGPLILVVTADPVLAERLSGLAATAGVALEHRSEPTAAGWSEARHPLLLLGPDVAAGAPRRRGVVLVCLEEPEPEIWQRAVEVGAEEVAVLPAAEPWLLERMLDAASPAPRARVIGVIGGRGGAGASTLAVALGAAGTRAGRRTLLVDGDPLGGGLDLMVGAERDPGLRWPDLVEARGRLQPGVLPAGLPAVDGGWVLSWDRGAPGDGVCDSAATSSEHELSTPGPGGECPELPAPAVEAVLRAAVREFDLVVIDLSRRFSPGDLTAVRTCDVLLLVVPAEVRATAAAGRIAAALEPVVADQRLVVRGPAPSGLAADSIADLLGLPLAGEVRWEPSIAAAIDRGEPLRPRGTLAALAGRLVAEVAA